MHPKLRDYVFFTPLDDGSVFFRSQTGNVVFRGNDSYRWVERLAPLLNGQRSVDDICQGIDEQRQIKVRALIDRLVETGLVRDSEPDAEASILEQEAQLYAASLSHLENYSLRPYQLFETIRSAKVFVAGRGPAAQSTIKALLEMGLRHLVVWTPGTEVESTFAHYQQRDASIEWRRIETKGIPVLPTDSDMVVYVAERYGDESSLQLLKQSRVAGKVFLSGGFLNELLYIGPFSEAGRAGCPACALLRMGASLEQHAYSSATQETSSVYTGVLGYYLAYQVFCHLAGLLSSKQETELVSFDLDTVTLQHHRLYPWPGCFYCHPKEKQETDLIAEFATRQQAPDHSVFQDAVLGLVDEQVGILGHVVEEESEFLPLHQVRVGVHDQSGNRHGGYDLLIPAPNLQQARYCALRAGLAAYARGMTQEPQEHWWTERGQLATHHPQKITAFATGLTYWEWIGTGLLEITRHYAWTRAEQFSMTAPWTGNGMLSKQLIVAIKMLRVRFNMPIEAHLLHLPQQFPGCAMALYSRGQLVEVCVDVEPTRALERGLLCLLQHAYQTEHHANASTLTLLAALHHDLTHDVFFQDIDWATWTPAACERSHHAGFAVLLHPEIPDPALDAVGLLTGYVGLVPTE